MTDEPRRYVEVDRFTRHVMNPLVSRLTRWGISVWGSRVLEVRGRRSGLPRRTPVNVLSHDGDRYLVAPRGETEWVRNVRAAGTATLHLGRRAEEVTVREVRDEDKPPILRAYLKRWKWEVGKFFEGVGPDASDAELLAVAPDHPVFRLGPAPSAPTPPAH
jgi:deazaflavin-dependent oxidoreductase (nitroreductase family)